MATVWRAQHQSEAIEVAVKVLTASRAREQRFIEGFQREVLAVAGLNHPGIITVHDYGWVDELAEQQSGGEFLRESPYLVMELIRQGSLDRFLGQLTWHQIRSVLLLVLDALAHAHARGVVHRDLKPNNVLIDTSSGEVTVRLTDFGLAHAVPFSELREVMDEETIGDDGMRRILGTPRYMAPEQIEGALQDQGPWTDLYALGCLAYCLATGNPPFADGSKFDVLRAHIHSDPPPMKPVTEVPRGFELWVRKLLMKNPLNRFTRAADAAYALFSIDESVMIPVLSELKRFELPEDAPTLVQDVIKGSATLATAEWSSDASTWEPENRSIQDRATAPPMPRTWRGHRPPVKRPLSGTGLGVFGVRSVPMVGRDNELDLLWNCLRIVRQRNRPYMVAITGGAGIGKTRIVREFVERAHEVGAARTVNHQASPEPDAITSMASMIRNYIRAEGKQIAEVYGRLRRSISADLVDFKRHAPLHDDDMLAVARMLVPQAGQAVSSANERYATVSQFFRLVAGPRPLIAWIDDAHWDAEAIAFVEYALQNLEIPILFVLTVRQDLLDTGWLTSQRLEQLGTLPNVEQIYLDYLGGEDHRKLVELMLGLEPELAQQVEARTQGNPLFAVQLVGDLVQRGVLTPGRDGFRLRAGASASIPDDIHHLWIRRIDQLAEQYDGQFNKLNILRGLEVAAAFGGQVDFVEWRKATEDLTLPDDLVARLQALQLAEVQQSGWYFAHAMLGESIQRRSIEENRWATCHLRCVRALRELTEGQFARGLMARIGSHLFSAGEFEDAVDPLIIAAREHFRSFEGEQGNRYLSLAEDAMAAADVPRNDPRWAGAYFLRAKSQLDLGQIAEGEATLAEIIRVARPIGWDVELEVNMLNGILAERAGRLHEAVEYFEAARELSGGASGSIPAEVFQGLGVTLMSVGRMDESLAAFEKAQILFEELGLAHGRGSALLGISQIYRARAENERALKSLEQARVVFEEAGVRVGLSRVLNDLGDVVRDMGDLETAERHYRRSFEIMRSTGFAFVGVPALNLGHLLAARGEFRAAYAASENAEALLRRDKLDFLANYCIPLKLLCVAELGQWDEFEELFEQTRSVVQSGAVERDLAESLSRTAASAHRAGHSGWAMDCYHLAVGQFRALGLEKRARELEDVADLISEQTVSKS